MNNKKYPIKLSVVIPCFNKSKYLIEMLKCIENQTFRDWELILVDDGSEDSEFNKVHDFVSDDPRITHMRRNRLPKNGDTCRNIGMEMAQGEYLIIFDADDLISETCFENRVKFMEEHPDCNYASFPSGTFVDGKEDKVWSSSFNYKRTDILGSLLAYKYPFTVWGNIYRNSSLCDIRWDENVFVNQDFDFMVQCALKDLKHLYADASEYDYFYRIFRNGNSVCSNFISEQKRESTLYLFDKTLKALSLRSDFALRREAFMTYIVTHFERLMKGSCFEDVRNFVEMLSHYYDDYDLSTLRNILSKSERTKSRKLMLIKLHWSLYQHYHMELYKQYCIHEIVKLLIFKKF